MTHGMTVWEGNIFWKSAAGNSPASRAWQPRRAPLLAGLGSICLQSARSAQYGSVTHDDPRLWMLWRHQLLKSPHSFQPVSDWEEQVNPEDLFPSPPRRTGVSPSYYYYYYYYIYIFLTGLLFVRFWLCTICGYLLRTMGDSVFLDRQNSYLVSTAFIARKWIRNTWTPQIGRAEGLSALCVRVWRALTSGPQRGRESDVCFRFTCGVCYPSLEWLFSSTVNRHGGVHLCWFC